MRRCASALAALLGACAISPQTASAHGIVGRADLPIPVWLFSWAAAVVLVVSFVALSTLWTTPQLQERRLRLIARLPSLLQIVPALIGLALFALVIYSGLDGASVETVNFSVTFIYVVFWVGLPLASALLGDIFPALSPWRTTARALTWAGRALLPARAARPRLPERLGVWPAVAGLVGFGWLELVYVYKDRPSTLAALSLGYFAVMVAGMLVYGVQEWEARCDGLALYLATVARIAPLEWGAGAVRRRRPLSALTDMEIGPGMVVFICALIGVTTFDGFSNGGYWKLIYPPVQELLEQVGLGTIPALEITYTIGLLACVGLVRLVYLVGIRGVAGVSGRFSSGQLTRSFAHTLVPIALAYVLAHYFSFLVWQGQAVGYLISDPLGNGTDYLGTGHWQIDYNVISFAAIWYVQVAALIAGHVGGLALAHDRSLAIYEDPAEAVRSQYWMLGVMVAFTSFGLWLLSAVGT